MATDNIKGRISSLYNTKTNWDSETTILNAGEIAIDSTNNLIKVGDGTKKFSDLDYIGKTSLTLTGAITTSSTDVTNGDVTIVTKVAFPMGLSSYDNLSGAGASSNFS